MPGPSPWSLVDPEWELIDPTPDPIALFREFNKRFFWGSLDCVVVKWSPRMTSCAGVCVYEGKGGLCSVRLSQALLKFRPRKDLVETLLHEMIHAYLFVTANNRDRDGHGPEFCKHMSRINNEAKTNITIYHSFHNEVSHYQQHWWKCDGPCQHRKPYFGLVKRANNRAPGPNDFWWKEHKQTCGGTYNKIKEPEEFAKKQLEKKARQSAKTNGDITKYLADSKRPKSLNTSNVALLAVTKVTGEKLGSNIHGFGKSGYATSVRSVKPEVLSKKKQIFSGVHILGSNSHGVQARKLPGIGLVPLRTASHSESSALDMVDSSTTHSHAQHITTNSQRTLPNTEASTFQRTDHSSVVPVNDFLISQQSSKNDEKQSLRKVLQNSSSTSKATLLAANMYFVDSAISSLNGAVSSAQTVCVNDPVSSRLDAPFTSQKDNKNSPQNSSRRGLCSAVPCSRTTISRSVDLGTTVYKRRCQFSPSDHPTVKRVRPVLEQFTHIMTTSSSTVVKTSEIITNISQSRPSSSQSDRGHVTPSPKKVDNFLSDPFVILPSDSEIEFSPHSKTKRSVCVPRQSILNVVSTPKTPRGNVAHIEYHPVSPLCIADSADGFSTDDEEFMASVIELERSLNNSLEEEPSDKKELKEFTEDKIKSSFNPNQIYPGRFYAEKTLTDRYPISKASSSSARTSLNVSKSIVTSSQEQHLASGNNMVKSGTSPSKRLSGDACKRKSLDFGQAAVHEINSVQQKYDISSSVKLGIDVGSDDDEDLDIVMCPNCKKRLMKIQLVNHVLKCERKIALSVYTSAFHPVSASVNRLSVADQDIKQKSLQSKPDTVQLFSNTKPNSSCHAASRCPVCFQPYPPDVLPFHADGCADTKKNQANNSAMCSCPVCGKSVSLSLINSHLDLGCTG